MLRVSIPVLMTALAAGPGAAQVTEIRGDIYYRLHTTLQGEERSLAVVNGGVRNDAARLDPAAEVQSQFWRIVVSGDGFARITTMFRGPWICLDVVTEGGFLKGGAEMRRCDGAPTQSWRFVREDNAFRLLNAASGTELCLESLTGGGEDGLAAMRPCGYFGTQFWMLVPTAHRAE